MKQILSTVRREFRLLTKPLRCHPEAKPKDPLPFGGRAETEGEREKGTRIMNSIFKDLDDLEGMLG